MRTIIAYYSDHQKDSKVKSQQNCDKLPFYLFGRYYAHFFHGSLVMAGVFLAFFCRRRATTLTCGKDGTLRQHSAVFRDRTMAVQCNPYVETIGCWGCQQCGQCRFDAKKVRVKMHYMYKYLSKDFTRLESGSSAIEFSFVELIGMGQGVFFFLAFFPFYFLFRSIVFLLPSFLLASIPLKYGKFTCLAKGRMMINNGILSVFVALNFSQTPMLECWNVSKSSPSNNGWF